MNPLEKRIEELERIVKALSSTTTIPFNIEKAFKARLGISSFSKVSIATDADPAQFLREVDESGASSYDVMAPPDEILRVKFDGLDYDIPAFNP
jgi:hypothetical protein